MENKVMPKILQIINSLDMGGAEKLLLETLPLYALENIKVDLLLLNGKDSHFLNELRKFNNIKIYNLNLNIYNPIILFKIIPFFKRYDLIHVNLFPSIYWVSLAKFISRSKIKLILTEHAIYNKRMSSKLFRIIDRFVYQGFDKIVTISNDVDSAIKKHLAFSNHRFQLILNGINIKNIHLSKASQDKRILDFIGSNGKMLIQVSRFQKQKDQKTLIRAMSLLPSYVKLILVGDGELRRECELLSDELRLSHRIRFLGIRKDVPQLLKLSDVVILSTWFEGLSLSSVEGLASGKPFIGSDSPGLREVVKGAGIVFPPGDHKLLARHVQSLLLDKVYYDDIARSCVDRSRIYDVSHMLTQHIDMYCSMHTSGR
jgi:glycosyltransferase involved in cell wall biosynthesis